ncbi:MAG: TRAP transporter substrate-binding protein DctP [Rhodospirillaceae bacterium]|nr:TRAP transporter substrate-binding protein DctP [Rhodospirillaceae bacterium]
MRKLLALAAVAAMGFAPAAGAQEVTLKSAVFVPVSTTYGAIYKRWVDEVNKRGKGTLQITVVGPEAVPTFQQWQAVKSGLIDMHAGPPAYYVGQVVETEAAVLSEYSMAELRKNGGLALLDKYHREKINAVLLTAYADGVSFNLFTTRPLNLANKEKPAEGFTLRATPNFIPFFVSLGARTVTTPPGEVYTALERHTVDGYGWPTWGIGDFQWTKFTKYRYDPGFFNVICNIMVNQDKWNKLSKKQQDFLTEMSIWLETEWPKWRAEIDAREADIQKKAGVQVIDMGPEWKKRAHDIYWASLAKRSPEGIAKIKPYLTRK